MTGELSTWDKAKETFVRWAFGLLGLGLLAIVGLLLDIRWSMATYQANSTALKDRVDKIENWTNQHDRDDRAKFQALSKESR